VGEKKKNKSSNMEKGESSRGKGSYTDTTLGGNQKKRKKKFGLREKKTRLKFKGKATSSKKFDKRRRAVWGKTEKKKYDATALGAFWPFWKK